MEAFKEKYESYVIDTNALGPSLESSNNHKLFMSYSRRNGLLKALAADVCTENRTMACSAPSDTDLNGTGDFKLA